MVVRSAESGSILGHRYDANNFPAAMATSTTGMMLLEGMGRG